MKKRNKLRLTIEGILALVVLLLLFNTFQPDTSKFKGRTDADVITEVPTDQPVSPTKAPYSGHIKVLVESGLTDASEVTEFPEVPEGLPFFDKSKFTEAIIKVYEAGTEYELTFIHPGETNFIQFGEFYAKFAEENGYDLTVAVAALNGTQTKFLKDNVEIRHSSFIRVDENEQPYIKEKYRLFVLE